MQPLPTLIPDPVGLFAGYLAVTGVAHTGREKTGDPRLLGKRLGLLNGSAWIGLWSSYFGRLFLPGVHLLNAGSEAVQVNFMEAHQRGEPVPPPANVAAFTRYARDLVALGRVDAVLITCSTMNRAYPSVRQALAETGVPVLQIDRPMMERAVALGGRALVIATHGPTVASTQSLLRETALAAGKPLDFAGQTVEIAWDCLAAGDVAGHNRCLAEAIRRQQEEDPVSSVVLAQLSMTVFLLTYPDPPAEFGVPVLTSGQCGFEAVRELFLNETHA
jgi:hypothetical protein